ncbi:MAG: YkgJ family cysteine cluster protein [Deltaproteobacteria bacterium]|nr:YkgJ family cysteine cluster protein [Deltaproteobacteria bacterium]
MAEPADKKIGNEGADHRDAARGSAAGVAADASWYRDGLRFACTSCGRCCTGHQGYVWVSAGEAVALAEHLGLELDDFGRHYLRRVGMRLALLDGAGGDCVFLQGKLCSVYELRPAQCRSFPWWPSALASPESWRRTALECEGIREDAPLVAAEVIDAARPDRTERGAGGR